MIIFRLDTLDKNMNQTFDWISSFVNEFNWTSGCVLNSMQSFRSGSRGWKISVMNKRREERMDPLFDRDTKNVSQFANQAQMGIENRKIVTEWMFYKGKDSNNGRKQNLRICSIFNSRKKFQGRKNKMEKDRWKKKRIDGMEEKDRWNGWEEAYKRLFFLNWTLFHHFWLPFLERKRRKSL